jgi:hypothetical protein
MYLLNLKLYRLIEDDMNYPLIFFINFFINFLMWFFYIEAQKHIKVGST